MATFVLGEQIQDLGYDFSPYGGEGIIPEPSAEQIKSFRRAFAQLVQSSADSANKQAPEDMIKAAIELLNKDTSELDTKILMAVAEVCSGKPSFDELDALPYRAQNAFVGWCVGTFLLPEVPTLATKS
jgi:hypothetical protein